jgi:CHAT domain-containing protein
LSSQGRKAEALEVSELLKLQEIRDINRGSDVSKVPEVTLNPQEQQIQQQYDNRIALGEKIYRCEQGKDKCSNTQLKQLRDESDRLRKEFDKKIQQLEKLAPERKGDFIKGYQSIVESQPGTLLVYPIILENKIWILWASAGGILGSKEVSNVGQNKLWQTVREYRELLKYPSTNITKLQATSKQLYQWLIAPIESEVLKDKGIKHLVFSLDGATRYIPMGALFDGQKYLIENYTVSTVPAVSLTNSRDTLPKEIEKTPILALGVSQEFPKFPALKSVPSELDAIVKQSPTDMKGIYPGKEILNSGFSYEALRDNIIGQKIIHIATHGKFLPNNPKESYLLMGTGTTLPISEIEQLRNLGNVHLIVLSACETALGEATQDGKEILGISNYFIGGESKAKAVIASLWVVSDDSTSLLSRSTLKNVKCSF